MKSLYAVGAFVSLLLMSTSAFAKGEPGRVQLTGTWSLVRVIRVVTPPTASGGAVFPTALGVDVKVSHKVAVGLQGELGLFELSGGGTVDYAPSGWARHGLLLSGSLSYYVTLTDCPEGTDCNPMYGEGFLGGLGEAAVAYRWPFAHGHWAVDVGASGSVALGQPQEETGLKWLLGASGPRIQIRYTP